MADQPIVPTLPTTPSIQIPECTLPGAPVITECAKADGGKRYVVLLNGQIFDSELYVKLLYILNTATDKDTVEILLQTPGGSVFSGVAIMNAIWNTKAEVINVANGACASMGANILMCGDQIFVRPWGSVMFHGSSHCDFGKSISIIEKSTVVVAYINFIMESAVARGLLTEEEFLRINNEKCDIFISAETMNARLANLKPSNRRSAVV